MMIDGLRSGVSRLLPTSRPWPVPAAGGAQRPAAAEPATNGSAVLVSLRQGASFASLTPAAWRAMAGYLSGLTPAQRDQVTEDFALRNMLLKVQDDGQEVTVMGMGGQATVDLSRREVRVGSMISASVYRDDALVETINRRQQDGLLEVVADGRTQLWNRDDGKGFTADGQPLSVRWADRVPGEAPRKPWAAPLPSRFVPPPATADDTTPAFGRLYDQAVLAMGGEVVEPAAMDVAGTLRFNCHSFATTGTHGDLLDPFDKGSQPRWINLPTFQLANGPFKRVAPDQRVHVGDVIMYADDDGVPTHTGRVTAVDADGNPSQVESKWGGFGLYKHAPFDVPGSYGHIEAFYRPER